MIGIGNAIRAICPNAVFVVYGDVVDWRSPDITQPTEAEIQAEIARLEAEQPWNELRQQRNRLLAESDWVSMKAIDASIDGLGIQLPQVWMDYRQALRDLPANTTDPTNPVWPTKPEADS